MKSVWLLWALRCCRTERSIMKGPSLVHFLLMRGSKYHTKSISQDLCQMQTCSIDRADWRIHVGIKVWDEWMICIQAEIHAIHRGKLSRSKSLLFIQLVFWLRLSILLTNSIQKTISCNSPTQYGSFWGDQGIKAITCKKKKRMILHCKTSQNKNIFLRKNLGGSTFTWAMWCSSSVG